MRAPMTTLSTVGRCRSQFSATTGTGLLDFLGDCLEGIDHFVEVFVFDLRAEVGSFVQAAFLGKRLAAADFAGQAAPAEGAPDDGADALIDAEGHQLPLEFAADERVIGLVGDVAGPAVAVGDGEGLHQVPAGEVGAGDVADFAALDEVVERAEGFFDGGGRVEAVHVVDVDVVGAEAAEAGFDGFQQVDAGGADVVDVGADAEGGFGGDEELVAAAFDGLAEDFFGEAVGIDVGGVEAC